MKFTKKNPLRFLSRLASSTSTYKELPSIINLTIVKWDGNEFEVQVGRNATVAKVKKAIEDVVADKQVRWPFVWGYLWLVYKDYKLIDDKDRIRNIPIHDRSKLSFVRHRLPGAACILEDRGPGRKRIF
ncbi:U11/U12 small nuclear ribonucleoprotein 25 kDa protein-like [Papaver somniferum]|uniref:U11/U12 small nuclear ribonucleoprotein 25 kDa protein-like n=1 Tax=Papaver somniferum TaxID=3469 RepID=UPI000E704BF3|nr:U11/U12 small nuclear ribonucleoprotein 25 kDa protein-like [Papaver somniferum]